MYSKGGSAGHSTSIRVPEGRLTIVSVAPIFLARSRIPSNPQLAILSTGRERLVTNAHSVILSNQ
jgi:hypothetical protein